MGVLEFGMMATPRDWKQDTANGRRDESSVPFHDDRPKNLSSSANSCRLDFIDPFDFRY